MFASKPSCAKSRTRSIVERIRSSSSTASASSAALSAARRPTYRSRNAFASSSAAVESRSIAGVVDAGVERREIPGDLVGGRAHLSSFRSSRRAVNQTPSAITPSRYATWISSSQPTRPEREVAHQVDAVVERRQRQDPLDCRRILVERHERRREEEHRQREELDEREVGPRAHQRHRREPERRERGADQQRGRHREDRPPGLEQPEREHDHDERDRVDRAAHQGEDRLAHRDVAHPERRREHAVVRLRVVELEEDVAGRLVDRAVHGGGREERRRHELLVRDRLALVRDVADERPDADAEADEVEERLEEAGDDDEPVAARRRRLR